MNVTLNDTDISSYTQGNSFSLTSASAEVGQVLINPVPTLVGIDTEGFWNPDNPVSVLYGINDLSVYTIKVFEGSLELFSGTIQNVNRQPNGLANVELQTELQRLLDQNIIYSSGSGLNPAQVFMDVCKYYKINYDPVTALYSSSVYETDSIRVSANILTPDTTILSFLETLSQAGVASIYSVGNYLYYTVYEDGPITNPVVTLEDTYDSDSLYILTKPVIANLQKEIPDGYSITYKSTLIATDQVTEFGSQNNSFSVSGGATDLITVDNLQSATWIGEQWLEYLSRADSEISLMVSTELARDLQVGYPIRLEMNDNTAPLNLEIDELTTLNEVQTQLRGVSHA